MKSFVLVAVAAFLVLPVHADRFKEWDQNKDGKLQKDELPANARRHFERVDTNRDGVISLQEHLAFVNRRSGGEGKQQAHPDYRTVRNQDYVGEGNRRQMLDLFLPREKSANPRPLVVYIHGGGWRAGSKDGGFGRLRPFLEETGFAGAAINYRLTNEASWPAQIHDCKAAIRWLKAHAGEYGYDADRIAVWGTSAGGHLVGMLGVSGDVPGLEGKLGKHLKQESEVTCVVNYFGPSNLLTMDDYPSSIKHNTADSPEGKLVGGALQKVKKVAVNASPVTHVSAGDAPMLLAHGTKDKLVPYQQSVEFSERLSKEGVEFVFITMDGAGHGFRSEELTRRVRAFLAIQLMGKEGNLSSGTIAAGK